MEQTALVQIKEALKGRAYITLSGKSDVLQVISEIKSFDAEGPYKTGHEMATSLHQQPASGFAAFTAEGLAFLLISPDFFLTVARTPEALLANLPPTLTEEQRQAIESALA